MREQEWKDVGETSSSIWQTQSESESPEDNFPLLTRTDFTFSKTLAQRAVRLDLNSALEDDVQMADRVFREMYGSVVFPSPKVMIPGDPLIRENHIAYNEHPSSRLKEKKMDENNETTTELIVADKKTVVRNRVLIAVGTAIGIFAAAALLKLITSTEDTIEVDGDATIVIEPSE